MSSAVASSCCGGIDVHSQLMVCAVRYESPSGERFELAEFQALPAEYPRLVEWFVAHGCQRLALESTGVYWRTLYWALRDGGIAVTVANPRDVRIVGGRKTDRSDAQRLATLLAMSVLKASFVPSREQERVRDVTRLRAALVRTHTQTKLRLLKLLVQFGVRLDTVLSDALGVSGVKLLKALIAGERDVERLLALVHASIRHREDQVARLRIVLAAGWPSTTTSANRLVQLLLERLEFEETQLDQLEHELTQLGVALPEFGHAVTQLDSIPGIGPTSAALILGEIGWDMTRFSCDKHLASWAGVCPGNRITGGKSKSGKPAKGNSILRQALVECAWPAIRALKGQTEFGRKYHAMVARGMPKPKAALAVAHQLLRVIYAMLKSGQAYDPRYAINQRDARHTAYLAQLETV